MSNDNLKELKHLESDLSSKLKIFVREASVKLEWNGPGEVSLPIPDVKVKLAEDGFVTEVGKTGHGLQRAFVISLFLAVSFDFDRQKERGRRKNSTSMPGASHRRTRTIQHPNRQRSFANILLEFAKGKIPGVVEDTQIIYLQGAALPLGTPETQ